MEREKGRERITTSYEYERESCPKVGESSFKISFLYPIYMFGESSFRRFRV
jgi:hypothetical protein